MKEEPGGFVDGDEEPEEEAAAAAADGDEEEDDDEEDDDGDELGYLHETTTQGGLAGALEMARGRGMLGADGPTSGRMFDQKGAGLHDYEDGDGDGEGKAGYEGARLAHTESTQRTTSFSHTPLLPGAQTPRFSHTPLLPHPAPHTPRASRPRFELNYFDEYGRKMTQKQAFRQLSWKFHGKGPSKKRREKRMQVIGPRRHRTLRRRPHRTARTARLPRLSPRRPPARRAPLHLPLISRLPVALSQDMERQMDESSKDRAMDYMGALQHAQQSSKSAHVVLSGINAIRPADVAAAAAGGGGAERAKKKAKKGGPAGGFNTG